MSISCQYLQVDVTSLLAPTTFISALETMKKEYNQIHEATEITISLRIIHLCAILMDFLSLGMHY